MASFVENGVTFQWSDVFETGHPEIDRQHRQLLSDSARLRSRVENGAAWNEVRSALSTLLADCSEHFRYEETVLREFEFPRAEAHAQQHWMIENILQQLANLVAAVDEGGVEERKMAMTLERKILEIIVRHDLDYKSHLLNVSGR